MHLKPGKRRLLLGVFTATSVPTSNSTFALSRRCTAAHNVKQLLLSTKDLCQSSRFGQCNDGQWQEIFAIFLGVFCFPECLMLISIFPSSGFLLLIVIVMFGLILYGDWRSNLSLRGGSQDEYILVRFRAASIDIRRFINRRF